MLGVIVLVVLLVVELGFSVYCILTKSYQKQKKSIAKITVFALGVILCLFGVIQFSFRWNMLFLILLINALMGAWYLWKGSKKEKTFGNKYVIMAMIRNSFLITFAVIPAILFPQFKPLERSGAYEVGTVSYTLTDPNRVETFSEDKDNRKVTIEFWYPTQAEGKLPLVVFSHGSFGFRGSNQSTFEELASNGYVVCSIDHTYHAFFTKQTDGNTVLANMDFINDAIAATNDDYDDKKTYELTQGWLELRLGDMSFVLEDILKKTAASDSDPVYQMIDTDNIGLFGHSLGGATAAELGRERKDIDAVIVIDGTMLGEEIGFSGGKVVLNDTPYPVPLLNIYNEEHYMDATKEKESYDNMVATANALDARQVVVKGAGHLNFTDLPLFSPFLAGMLGTGEVDSRYCIETMNQIVLNYFDYYLKGAEELNIQEEY